MRAKEDFHATASRSPRVAACRHVVIFRTMADTTPYVSRPSWTSLTLLAAVPCCPRLAVDLDANAVDRVGKR
jgi:hypothetical protein